MRKGRVRGSIEPPLRACHRELCPLDRADIAERGARSKARAAGRGAPEPACGAAGKVDKIDTKTRLNCYEWDRLNLLV